MVSVLLTLPLQCYLFHMYVGVRAGGGIGDEIEDPAGDEYELYRVVFDITFFFFVIVILLAIIQGQCWLGWGSWGSVPRGRPPPLRVQAQEPVWIHVLAWPLPLRLGVSHLSGARSVSPLVKWGY